MDRRWVKHSIGLGAAAGLFLGSAFIPDPSKMIYGLVLGIAVLMWSEYKFGDRED